MCLQCHSHSISIESSRIANVDFYTAFNLFYSNNFFFLFLVEIFFFKRIFDYQKLFICRENASSVYMNPENFIIMICA